MAYDLATLAEGIKRANAAGNVDAVKKLGAAYRRMQAQGSNPSAIKAGQDMVYAGQWDQKPSPNLLDSTLATVNGLTASVPGLQQASDALVAGGQTVGDIVANRPGTLSQHYADIQKSRDATAEKAPLANAAGEVAGTLALPGVAATTKAGAEALGLTGSLGKQLLNSAASTAAYSGVQGLTHGHTGGELLADEAIGAAGGAAGSVAGNLVAKAGKTVADALTGSAQRKITAEAIKGASAASELKSASSQLLENATGGNAAPAVTSGAFDRLMGTIQSATARFRPNAANDPKAVGLLQHMADLATAAKTPGVVVDLKDLHLAQQLAQNVARSKDGRDSAIGTIVIKQIDDFINGLKSSDILGGADPRQAANDLMRGKSLWSRAKRVQLVEDAVKFADTYKSGFENGLQLSFHNLMKTDDFARFSPAEQAAIREVAKGTTKQNLASLLGKMGISVGGHGAHNIISGGLGTTGLTAALTPVLGPAAFPAALTATSVAGAVGRRAAEKLAREGAGRAAQVMATPGIKTAVPRPNLLAPVNKPIQLLIRGSAVTAAP